MRFIAVTIHTFRLHEKTESKVGQKNKLLTPGSFGLISHTFSINEQYFSLTTNQPTVLSAMTYQPSEQDVNAL